jgi:uncharacterized protein YjiS (DUF1127 family)
MRASTYALSATSPTSTSSTPRGFGALLKDWWVAYWQHRARRATVFMLGALDDHALHDIGLARGEIESVVYGKCNERLVRYEPVAK